MNKLKTVFQRSQKLKTEERRPQQFVSKRLSTTSSTPTTHLGQQPPPEISLSELSEIESEAYQSWWKDLDPFDLGIIDNPTILKFLNGCSLADDKLEQILALFEPATEGLNKLQFFAMLRLIAHAQNGRKISRALIYLGAPIPHFHTNAIDALIKTLPTAEYHPSRKSWWGQDLQTEQQHPYPGPFTAHTPIPDTTQSTIDYHFEHTDPSLNNTLAIRPALNSALTTTATITPVTPNIIQLGERHHTHSRSRSAGTASDFSPYSKSAEEELQQLQSSKSSLSLHELNTGKTLLLTQKFVYQSPSTRHQELASNNPFYQSNTNLNDNNKNDDSNTISPFDDHHCSMDPINQKPNNHAIPPPPVPSQSTKPAFPKYARTNNYVKRSQSSAADHSHSHSYQKHQRHRSFY
ncbi:hypothetical protein EDC96DRAFT_510834 [Choanephora cucurbitarum]|nr:hypothetical protein EDC96DRAFT_510834 [Choanephora cucurbitarum]